MNNGKYRGLSITKCWDFQISYLVGFYTLLILTTYSMNNAVGVISSCVDCQFWKSVKLKNELKNLSAY